MNAATIAATVIATVSVATAVAGMAALTYRIGRLVGNVEALIKQGATNYAHLEGEISVVNADLKQHITGHGRMRHRR